MPVQETGGAGMSDIKSTNTFILLDKGIYYHCKLCVLKNNVFII